MKKMQEKYQDKTLFLLEGNFLVDRMCEEPLQDTTHHNIQIHAAANPRFLLKDIKKNEYASSDLNSFLKQILSRKRNEEMLLDHPELESTKFSPEINWNASTWPLGDKKSGNDKLISFQYKLKSESLTPARRHAFQAESKRIPKLNSAKCIVCKHPTQKADMQHIFSSCTVAFTHNTQLWNDIQRCYKHNKVEICEPWFCLHQNHTGNTNTTESEQNQAWQKQHGNTGYIPASVTSVLPKSMISELQATVAQSRFELWKDYWKNYIELLQTPSNSASSPGSNTFPAGEPPPALQQNQSAANTTSIQSEEATHNNKKQTTLFNFFSK